MDIWEYNNKKRKNNEEEDTKKEDFRQNGELKDENISSSDNHIYFYSSVTKKSMFELNKELRSVAQKMKDVGNRYDIDPPAIKLHINSNGGSIFSAMSCIDTIITSPVEIHSIVEGAAASAATLISVVCNKRYIKPHSFMLIHQLSTVFWGKMHEFDDEMKNLENLMKLIKNIYKEYTSVKEDKIEEILKHDIWWDAKKCKKLNLVDEILE
jgi:ATP-dependent protease ClpP protease subunit